MTELNLLPLIQTFPKHRIAVVGDLMLDRYIWGRASRISQEAPVPVVAVNRETQVPGGAANVARNICSLTGCAHVFGFCGSDEHGTVLRNLLAEAGANIEGIISLDQRQTTVKTRVIANNQQVVRVDREATDEIPEAALELLLQRLQQALEHRQVDAVIFEDYAKGVFSAAGISAMLDICHRYGVPAGLDPHPSHPFHVKGLTVMTPNRAEAFGLAGRYYERAVLPLAADLPLLEVGQTLRRQWQVEHLLVTLGAAGMALFHDNELPLHIPTRAKEVFDVSGAGDTVMAAFMMSLLAGATPAMAAQLANIAAGIVVAKVGTATVTDTELIAQIQNCHANPR